MQIDEVNFNPINDPNCPYEDLCGENYSLKEEQIRVEQALDKGMDVVRNENNILTFDLDSEEALATFKRRYTVLQRKGFCPNATITKSKSGNYHAVVEIHAHIEISETVKIAIQACLGSDWKREFLGVLRLLNGQNEQVSMLFRPTPLEIVEEL